MCKTFCICLADKNKLKLSIGLCKQYLRMLVKVQKHITDVNPLYETKQQVQQQQSWSQAIDIYKGVYTYVPLTSMAKLKPFCTLAVNFHVHSIGMFHRY